MRAPAIIIAIVVLVFEAHAAPDVSDPLTTRARLQSLGVVGSVLMIGAHDDDDDTLLLTHLSLGLHLRTGYLSLARGTGAQNRIGAEQADAMGVLLTQEALAARRTINVEQYYTRVFDFGFSKTLRESMDRWDTPDVVGDIVWVLRTFRPDIVILRYSGTPRDGHGNHQASAVLARKAISAAADPLQFTGQLKFAPTWEPRRIFQYGGSGPSTVGLEVGGKSPELTKSYSEFAGLSRSAFRSQAMAGAVYPSSRRVVLTPLDDHHESELLSGIDATWHRFLGGAGIHDALGEIVRNYSETAPDASLLPLLAIREKILSISGSVADPWIGWKLGELDEAIARCAGISARVDTAREIVTPAANVTIAAQVATRFTSLELTKVTLRSRDHELELLSSPALLKPAEPFLQKGTWTVPLSAPPSQPYWLVDRVGLVAKVADQTLIGLAADPPVLRARFQFRIGSRDFELTRPVRAQLEDGNSPPRSVPLVVAPHVTLHPAASAVIFPNGATRQLSVRVTSHRDHASGTVTLEVPSAWKCEPKEHPFDYASTDQSSDFLFTITPPSGAADATIEVRANIDGRSMSFDQTVVDYPHIDRTTIFPKARVRLVSFPVEVNAKTIGYVVGTGDDLPVCLEQLGCKVTTLTPQDLAERDLAKFDAIILGIRAYTVRPDVLLHKERLRDYMQRGGTLIMQYTVSAQGPNALVDVPNFGPYPFRLSAGRVTEEDATMGFSPANHLVLTNPNTITAADFSGWVQERGLHFASAWDPRYETPLECHDLDEAPMQGGLLFARNGRGVFIYTAHAWFRQLPAGVPGAYRAFANLLSAGTAQK